LLAQKEKRVAAQEDLRKQIEQTLQRLQHMEGQLRATQADVQGLPFLARGFVERDINKSTGRSLGEWAAASNRMYQALAPVASGADAASAASLIAAELPKLAGLRTYLQQAPEKVNMVPAAMLKPQQRTQFLGHVQQQVAELQVLENELRAIAAMLGNG
jgi:hypothetical protein